MIARTNFLILLVFIMFSCVDVDSQKDFLEPEWPILKHYDKDHLYRIALPLGGIGTGTVSLGGRGELRDWEIMNRPAKGFYTTKNRNNAPFFSIYVKSQGETPTTKALMGPLYDQEYQHMEGRSAPNHGLPRFSEASFDTSYPFGRVNLSDPNFPVDVKIIGFNPFIPGDADNSGIPIAVLTYEVFNKTENDIEVSVCGTLRNYIGQDGSKTRIDWKGESYPVGSNFNENEYIENDTIAGVYMYSNLVESTDPAWGTIALSTENRGTITYRTSSVPDNWGNAILNFWDDFSDDGLLDEIHNQFEMEPMASLATKKEIKSQSSEVFRFYITWHFPNRTTWFGPEIIGNYYTTQYSDAWDVISTKIKELPILEKKTVDFVNAFVKSDIPEVIKEAALFNLSTLRSQTVFRTPDGKMFGWEGCMDNVGSCWGSCTHVWNYEQATPFLFGELARTMRDVEFNHALHENGLMSFRVELPLDKAKRSGIAAADGQMGTIMKFYRDWHLSGDMEFLESNWLQIKSALSFSWIDNGWDADMDGVMEGCQHNTMDVEYFGPNPQMQLWYLGALRSAQKMAIAMNDRSFADSCEVIFNKGSKWTDDNLFNGEYYEQKVIHPESKEKVAPGLTAGMGGFNFLEPEYQLAQGCLVDQLVGQYFAHVVDLGYLVKPENVKKTLESIMKYNYMSSMNEHFNNMRSYALGNESSLLMASWPKGRPTIPFPYFSEVMTGFEYTAAIGMLYEDMEDDGLLCIENIRDRYNGSKRNPFDEAECGHHYARAMASWAGFLAETEFFYSGVNKTFTFTSKSGKYFWSNGYAWGTCEIKSNTQSTSVEVEVLHGNLEVNEIHLKDFGSIKMKGLKTIDLNEKFLVYITRD